jgi:hypothetical protein
MSYVHPRHKCQAAALYGCSCLLSFPSSLFVSEVPRRSLLNALVLLGLLSVIQVPFPQSLFIFCASSIDCFELNDNDDFP